MNHTGIRYTALQLCSILPRLYRMPYNQVPCRGSGECSLRDLGRLSSLPVGLVMKAVVTIHGPCRLKLLSRLGHSKMYSGVIPYR